MIKLGNNIRKFSTYSCQPTTRDELKDIIKHRIEKEGPNCNLNDIDTSLITDMSCLFYDSRFNGDISKWNTSNVKNMSGMFAKSDFNQPIGDWDVSNVIDMKGMFYKSKFNQDISNWNIRQDCDTKYAFFGCSIKEKYKPNFQ